MQHKFCCSKCCKPLLKVSNRCDACKKVTYCNKKCQKKHWKSHRANCTFDYLKANGFDTKRDRSKLKHLPFNTIDSSICSKEKFTSYLYHCNNNLLHEFALIIYEILTGYQFSINLSSHIPSKYLLSMHGKHEIEAYGDELVGPSLKLHHKTYIEGTDMFNNNRYLIETLDKNCKKCIKCNITKNKLNKITSELMDKVSSELNEEESKETFTKYLESVYKLTICKHLGYNWNAFPFYLVQYVRDYGDDSISILIQLSRSANEPYDGDYNTYTLACFRCNDIMPYFEGIHYAYFIKIILDYYHFNSTHYHKLTVGLSWSICRDMKIRRGFLKNIHKLLHEGIDVTPDFYVPIIHRN